MNRSQADMLDEYKQLENERDELRTQLESAGGGDKDAITARIEEIEKQRSVLWPQILQGSIEFGGE